jgi:hypothetical protein
MPNELRSYFEDRAEAEIKAAQEATHPNAVSAHYRLAGFYLDLTHNGARNEDGEATEGDSNAAG